MRPLEEHLMRRLTIVGLIVAAGMIWGCVPQQTTSKESVEKESQAHYQVGVQYLSEGKSGQALQELTAAQALTPGNADIEHALGLAYQHKGLYDKAIEHYKKALELTPKLTEARNNLGTVHLAKGEYQEAIRLFEECVKDPLYST
ncbi:MAG: tetratricopeptide repeat protein, partial [Deltaproteobacteria bacterium]|nr:tetratricopeptide repeat protein [Deltaproteobacteria bacterium]